jgi:TM2 domain-containing membrane protein YozV
MPGYHVEFFSKAKTTLQHPGASTMERPSMQDGTVFSAQTETVDKESQSNVMVNEQLTASSNEELNATSIPVAKPQKLKRNSTENQCDIIILKTGREILAKVLEIGNAEVKYKMCDNVDGPTISINKSDVFMIKYPNGTSTIINNTDNQGSSGSYNVGTEKNASDRNLLIAVLLWVFLGFLGIHRFYLGHTGMGVLYLLTGALCGIGWIIDGILFLTGSLQPKDGKYVN